MATPVKLQLHYFFTDEKSHSMNAFVRNDNEKEILLIFKEVMNALEITVDVESEALSEGGIRTIWRFIGANEKQIKLLSAILGGLLISVPLMVVNVKSSLLNDEKTKLEIQKLKREAIAEDSVLSQQVVDRAVKILEHNQLINIHKSNVYKKLSTVNEVTQLSTVTMDETNRPVTQERTIKKEQFNRLIINSNELEPETDEEAVIEIVAPVLKAGNYQWKGIYKNETINFYMLDQTFKGQVLRGDYSFSSGVSIKCFLDRKRKIDDTGKISIVKNNVVVVLEIFNAGKPSIVTEHGKAHIRKRLQIASQLSMFTPPKGIEEKPKALPAPKKKNKK